MSANRKARAVTVALSAMAMVLSGYVALADAHETTVFRPMRVTQPPRIEPVIPRYYMDAGVNGDRTIARSMAGMAGRSNPSRALLVVDDFTGPSSRLVDEMKHGLPPGTSTRVARSSAIRAEIDRFKPDVILHARSGLAGSGLGRLPISDFSTEDSDRRAFHRASTLPSLVPTPAPYRPEPIPRIEIPRIQMPKIERIEMPKFEMPKFERIEIPRIEVPKLETPRFERIEIPKFEVLKFDRIEMPKFDSSLYSSPLTSSFGTFPY